MRFATLGPEESNHAWVTKQYIAFHKLTSAKTVLFEDFEEAFNALLSGACQFLVQVAVHPSTASSVAKYRNRAHLIDCFLSPSQCMAVLTRKDCAYPTTLGLQPATRDYIDTSRWQSLIPEPTTVDVMNGLRTDKYDSGITLLKFGGQYSDDFIIQEEIGTVVDAWLVYGTEPTCRDHIQAWPSSPARRLFMAQ